MGARPQILDFRGLPVRREHSFAASRTIQRGVKTGGFQGVPGATGWGGLLEDPGEYSTDWQNLDTAVVRCREMKRDSFLRGAMGLRTLPIIAATLRWEPPEDDPTDEEIEAAQLAQRAWVDDPWVNAAQVVRWLMTGGLWDGFSIVEVSFSREKDTGYLVPVGLEYRSAYSIAQAVEPWVFDGAGRLVKVRQDPSARIGDRVPQDMDAQNLLIATHNHTILPSGESELRGVDRDEFLKHNALIRWGIRVNRWSIPTPKGKTAEGQGEDEREELLDALEAYQAGEDTALVVGFGQEVDVFHAGSDNEATVAKELVRECNEGMATALQVPFMVMGQAGSGGTEALAKVQASPYQRALHADALELVCTPWQAMNDRLTVQNFGPGVRSPRLVVDDIEEQAMTVVLDGLVKAHSFGGLGRLEDGDINRVRAMFGFGPMEAPELREDEDGERKAPGSGPPGDGGDPSTPTSRPGGTPDEGEDVTEDVVEQVACDCTAHEFVSGHTPFRLKREPRGAERVVDFAAAAEGMDNAVGRIRAITAEARAEVADDLVVQVRDAVGSDNPVRAIDGISAPNRLRRQMVKQVEEVLRDVMRQGRAAVQRELRRLDQEMSAEFVDPTAAPSEPENASAIARLDAQRLTARALDPMVEQAKDEARDIIASGATLGDLAPAALAALGAGLLTRSLRDVTQAANHRIPGAFGIGRQQTIEAEKEQGAEFVAHYSTMLDGNVCPNCSRAEDISSASGGLAVGSDEEIALRPPLRANSETGDGCEGGGQCRCIYVYERAELAGPVARDISAEPDIRR